LSTSGERIYRALHAPPAARRSRLITYQACRPGFSLGGGRQLNQTGHHSRSNRAVHRGRRGALCCLNAPHLLWPDHEHRTPSSATAISERPPFKSGPFPLDYIAATAQLRTISEPPDRRPVQERRAIGTATTHRPPWRLALRVCRKSASGDLVAVDFAGDRSVCFLPSSSQHLVGLPFAAFLFRGRACCLKVPSRQSRGNA